MDIKNELLAKCGFYCGACPTFLKGNCKGCLCEHQRGDCFTRDCVTEKRLGFCGECRDFPCETILTKPRTTLLDTRWLLWKKESDTNRN